MKMKNIHFCLENFIIQEKIHPNDGKSMILKKNLKDKELIWLIFNYLIILQGKFVQVIIQKFNNN